MKEGHCGGGKELIRMGPYHNDVVSRADTHKPRKDE